MTDEAIYDETGSKLLITALVAGDDTSALAALNGMRRYLNRENLPTHDIKVFFASGHPGTWMKGVLSIMQRATEGQIKAENGMKRYQKRLAVVETVLRRFRSILKDTAGSDTKDGILQWHMQNVRIDDSDRADDPAEAAYIARLMAAVPDEAE